MVRVGTGPSLTALPYPELTKAFKIQYIVIPLSITTTACAKISILCLYRRIFPTASFKARSLVLLLLVIAYWISAAVGSIAQCIPARAAYDKLVPGKCINFAAFFLGEELFNCLLDIIILCLPLTVIRKLHMPRQRKIQLGLIFLLGALVLIAGIIRMAVIYRAGSKNLNNVGDAVWATIENGFALICACMPTYGPLLSKAQTMLLSTSTWYSSLLSSTRTGSGTHAKPNGVSGSAHANDAVGRECYNQIHDETQDHLPLTEFTRAGGGDDIVAGNDYPLDRIRVDRTLEVF